MANEAIKYGVRVTPPPGISKGTIYWEATVVTHLTGQQNHGQHHIFVDVKSVGARVQQAKIIARQEDGSLKGIAVIDKVGPYGTDIPMYFNDTLSIYVEFDGFLSDTVRGLHTRHEDEEAGNTRGHHSFAVLFEKRPYQEAGPVDPGGGNGEETPCDDPLTEREWQTFFELTDKLKEWKGL
jgi:hypothetical protein